MPPEIAGFDDLVEVGRGGFGTVYSATDRRFGRQVAIKVIRDENVGLNVVARFERECLALGRLSGHPHIVAVHDQGMSDGGHLYLVMEFLGGGSFADRLIAQGPFTPAETASWGASLADALETAHRAGIVHRDVKPENILFSEYGAPKLVDFGIARMRNAYQTRTGFVSATLMHAAPEIVSGGAISPHADVYSLASVLFTVLTGHPPFYREGDETLAPLIARIATAPAPDLRPMGVPDDLADVVARALTKDPDQRYESAGAFAEALRACARTTPVAEAVPPPTEVRPAPPPVMPKAARDSGPTVPARAGTAPDAMPDAMPDADTAATPRRRRRWPALVAAAAVLAVAGGTAVVLTSGDDGDPPDARLERAASTPSESETPPPALPTARITSADGCLGLTCRFTVSSATPLPDDARWRWAVDGRSQTAAGPTLEHTFAAAGTATVSVVAARGEDRGTPGRLQVRLGTWQPAVAVTPASSTTARIAVRAPRRPTCVPGAVRLQVRSGGETSQDDAVRLTDGAAVVDLVPGTTYRVLVPPRDVRDGVCERAADTITLPVPDTGGSTGSTGDGGSSGGDGGDGGGGGGGGDPDPDPDPPTLGPRPNP